MTNASAASEAGMCVMAPSPTAKRTDDLDLVAGGERMRDPATGWRHDAVDGDGHAAAAVDTATAQQLGNSSGELLVSSIDADDGAHASSRAGAAKRSTANGRIASSTSPLRMNRLTASAVTGVSKIPLR